LSSNDLGKLLDLKYTSGDLFTSLGKVKIEYNVTKTKDQYITNIVISDKYDFEWIWSSYIKNPLITTMNNKARLDQSLGGINNYYIKINLQEFLPLNND